MNDLITRLERADGPSRELDWAIAESLGWTRRQVGQVIACYAPGDPHMKAGAPRYTASIDAALTLVPEGCLSMVRTVWADAHAPTERPVGYASVDRYSKDDAGLFWKENFLALGETPALALAAAALKARGV